MNIQIGISQRNKCGEAFLDLSRECIPSAKVGHIGTEGYERVDGSEGVGSHPLKGLFLTAHQSMPMLVMAQPKGERYDYRRHQTDS